MSGLLEVLREKGFEEAVSSAWDKRAVYLPQVLKDVIGTNFSIESVWAALRRSPELLKRTEVVSAEERVTIGTLVDGGSPTMEVIYSALQAGTAILGRRFDLDHDGAAEFKRALETITGHPAFGTLFITCADQATFPPHFDSADVFVLQMAGSKRWKLYDRIAPWPTTDADLYPVDRGAAEPAAIHQLDPGDVLYVPRGVIHSVTPTSVPSFHISFGVKVLTIADLLRAFVSEQSAVPVFRESLPLYRSSEWLAMLPAMLEPFVQRLQQPSSYAAALEGLRVVPDTLEWTAFCSARTE